MTTPRALAAILALLLPLALATSAAAQPEAAQDAFFQGLDLAEAGDCAGAIPHFERSLALNPALHQARLYLAECLHTEARDEEARAQLETYLTTDFPGAETDRAKALYVEAGGDLDELFPPDVPDVPDPPVTPDPWTAVSVELALQVDHYANRIGLTGLGPSVAARFLPYRWVELSVRGGIGFGGYPEHDGTVHIPGFAVGAAFSAPVGPVRIVAGVQVPLLVSRYGDAPRADVGILGEAGVRVAVPGSRLVIGGRFGGGFVVAPTVGGGVQVGFQLGPMKGGTP